MKKALFYIIVLVSFSFTELNAQCVPDLSLTSPGIVPDSATGLAHGIVGLSYSDTLQFRVPTDTTIIYMSFPVFFTINWVRIDSVLGLPPGFTWSTTECGSCALHSFNGGTNGCLLLSGPALPATGTYPLKIKLTANGTNTTIGTISLPDSNEDYSIVIDTSSGIQVYNTTTFEVYQNFPNPFSAQTEIVFTSPFPAKADFKVYDMLGREIILRNIDAVYGVNRITLSAKYFKPGIYFYTLNFKGKSVARKMIVASKP